MPKLNTVAELTALRRQASHSLNLQKKAGFSLLWYRLCGGRFTAHL